MLKKEERFAAAASSQTGLGLQSEDSDHSKLLSDMAGRADALSS